MWVQLSTGNDQFAAVGASSPRRNVSVRSFVRIDQPSMSKVIPMFAAYKEGLKGFKRQHIVSVIPATNRFSLAEAGQWFVNRQEVLPGTEILLEYRHRSPSKRSFGEDIEFLMLIADDKAPLWSLRLEMPHHEYSAVPTLMFEGRFHIMSKASDLTPAATAIWEDHIGIGGGDVQFADCMDINGVDDEGEPASVWSYIKLEDKVHVDSTVQKTVTSDGKERMRIRRGRRIKIR